MPQAPSPHEFDDQNQNAALQRRVDALNIELDEKARALNAAERRGRELEDEIKFLKEAARAKETARNSINSFIENVERNQSITVTEEIKPRTTAG